MSRTSIIIFIISINLLVKDSFFAQNADYAGQTQLLPFDWKTFNDLDRLPDLTWNNNNNCIIGKSIGTVSSILFIDALQFLSSNISEISDNADERIARLKITENGEYKSTPEGISAISKTVVNINFGSVQNLNIKHVFDHYLTIDKENISTSVFTGACKISTKLPESNVTYFITETDEDFIRSIIISHQNSEHTIINQNDSVSVYDPYQLLQLNNWLVKSLIESEIAINLDKKNHTLALFYDKKKVQDLITDELQKKYSNLDLEIIDNIVNEEIENFIKNQ